MVRASQVALSLRQLVLIGLALLLPRLGVTRADIGSWEQLQYLGYLLGFAWLAGLGQAFLVLAKPAAAPSLVASIGFSSEALGRTLLRLGWGLSAAVVVIFFTFEPTALRWLSGSAELPGWTYYSLFLLSHWPYLLYEQLLIAQGKAKRLLWVAILSNLALALAILLPLLLGYGWAVALASLLGVALLKALLLLPATFGKAAAGSTAYPVSRLYRLLLVEAAPLIGYAVLGTLVVSFGPWLVGYWYQGDLDQFAIYRYGSRELPFLAAITNGVSQAVLPTLSQDRAQGLAQLKASSLRLMHLCFPFILLLLLTSTSWWIPVFTPRFTAALPLFQVFLLVAISRFISPVVVLTATGHRSALLGIGLLELLLYIATSVWLLKQLGLVGVVWATVIVFTADRLVAAYYLYRREGISLGQYCHWPWLLGYSSLCALALWLVQSS